MIKPEIPRNEIQRLNVLHSLHILDTLPEERFNRITRIAHKLFDVPVTLISLVDKDREWFKSRYGWPVKELPRSISFCGHAILQPDIMVIEDTLKDVRFVDNPLVIKDPKIRFYLGCPLNVREKFNVGTLCFIDQKPRKFSETDLKIVQDLAHSVATEFDEIHTSETDELTHLANRQGFLAVGKKIIKLCNQFDKNLLLLFFDLEKLHWINEHYGYQEGDKTLRIFSGLLLKNFRRSDAVARLEGDKFCVLCSGMNRSHLNNVINRLQNKLDAIQTEHPIKFNVDAIQYDRFKHWSIDSLVEEAELKLYEHKRSH